LGSLRFAAYTGQTVESAEAHDGMDKCIVVLSTQSPTSKTIMRMKQWKKFKRENLAHEEWQQFDNDIPSAGRSRRAFFQDLRKILGASKL
jgi:hypothetical protein